jgi:NAD(P)-dependent dehydrogenase (short-subunit alcohol dehydrogenase family)
MIPALRTPAQQLVTVFGGSGFLGRYVVRALAKRGYRVLVATRRPDLTGHLQPLGVVGQIHAIQANLRHPASVAHAVAKADHVINLVGILKEDRRQSFDVLQADGPRIIAEAAARDARRDFRDGVLDVARVARGDLADDLVGPHRVPLLVRLAGARRAPFATDVDAEVEPGGSLDGLRHGWCSFRSPAGRAPRRPGSPRYRCPKS